MAFGLAVYASRCGLPQPHARLASGRWSSATGRAFHPQDSIERFQSASYISILLSQASWRNRTHRGQLVSKRSMRRNDRPKDDRQRPQPRSCWFARTLVLVLLRRCRSSYRVGVKSGMDRFVADLSPTDLSTPFTRVFGIRATGLPKGVLAVLTLFLAVPIVAAPFACPSRLPPTERGRMRGDSGPPAALGLCHHRSLAFRGADGCTALCCWYSATAVLDSGGGIYFGVSGSDPRGPATPGRDQRRIICSSRTTRQITVRRASTS